MTPFLFGKLPAHGDFVARGLDADARAALDAWLSMSLAQAQADAPDGFDRLYEQVPPWRGVWNEDGQWAAGALAASVDAVGRRFPILLGIRGVACPAAEDIAGALELSLYDALAAGWDADRLLAAAADVRTGDGDADPRERWWTVGADGDTAGELAGARPTGLMTAMLRVGQEQA